jgi:hypothetical protein
MTYSDIMLYVQEKLQRDDNMLQLLAAESRLTNQLIRDIVSKAYGVFLGSDWSLSPSMD